MADSTINLASPIPTTLTSLQQTRAAIDKTTRNLSTGKKVNDAFDDPNAYFQARTLSNLATDLSTVLDGINQSQAITTAATGASAISSLLDQMDGLAAQARDTTNPVARQQYAEAYNALVDQIDLVAQDSGYAGVNLLSKTSGDLTVNFGARDSTLTVKPADLSAAGLGIAKVAEDGTDFSAAAISAVATAVESVRTVQSGLGDSMATLQIRADFTVGQMDTLKEGAAKLTSADMNAEAVSLLTLQTRQQLGTTALAIANESQRSLLSLF